MWISNNDLHVRKKRREKQEEMEGKREEEKKKNKGKKEGEGWKNISLYGCISRPTQTVTCAMRYKLSAYASSQTDICNLS